MPRIALAALAFGALLLAAGPAGAQTNREMADYCRQNLRFIEDPGAFIAGPEALTAGICSGFFYNAHDFHNLVVLLGKGAPIYCPPEGTTPEGLIRAFLAWVEATPERAGQGFAQGYVRAMRQAFPCP